jgi:glycine/D-amino acid oxidase-like deaminating enzyme
MQASDARDHGFKFGPLLGSIVAGVATGGSSPWDLGAFSQRRAALTGG